LLLAVYTTRIELVGTELLSYGVFSSRCVDINSICEISRSEWIQAYKIVDSKGNKIWLSYYLSGVENLIKRINEKN